ncbi:MAG: hypothetical protein D5R96_05140 [Methanocalculus sp. MSAO_Arc2]|uniref:hypothetical protein n=1 Tax=Methanocalculus sp. MSAO_Arc2 TaxID=2293855 RepID=UPI000FED9BEC|nr:MAG: hypothetical protein D5R96_05140 [Methanocalculus sp. MSAO_Arc2]
MAQQKKTRKKQEINWAKLGAIAFAVLLAAAMVLSLLGTAWIGSFRAVEPGDSIVIDFTVYADEGIPILTTSERVWTSAPVPDDHLVYLTGPIEVTAGYTTAEEMVPIPHRFGQIPPFALLNPEFKTIVESPIGHRERDQITVPFTFETPDVGLDVTLSPQEFQDIGYSYDDVRVGDQILLGFAKSPEILLDDDAKSESMIRPSYVIEKTNESVTLRYGYSHVVITINSIR